MPALSPNIENRVRKLPKPSTHAQGMQPLFKAVSNKLIYLLLISLLCGGTCTAKDVGQDLIPGTSFAKTRAIPLDKYLEDNPDACNEDRHRPNRRKDNYYSSVYESYPWEAADIVLNEVFCQTAMKGKVDYPLIYSAVFIAVNASDLDGAKESKLIHPGLSIVADCYGCAFGDRIWALSELIERDLGLYGYVYDGWTRPAFPARKRLYLYDSLNILSDIISENNLVE